jgi:hypothetical protein
MKPFSLHNTAITDPPSPHINTTRSNRRTGFWQDNIRR